MKLREGSLTALVPREEEPHAAVPGVRDVLVGPVALLPAAAATDHARAAQRERGSLVLGEVAASNSGILDKLRGATGNGILSMQEGRKASVLVTIKLTSCT